MNVAVSTRDLHAEGSLMDKGVDLTGLLGGIKEDWGSGDGSLPSRVQGGATVGLCPPEAEAFL